MKVNNKLILVIVALIGTIAIYGAIVQLPFLFDDPIHIRWVNGRPWWRVWIDVEEMQHYRPLVMSLWALSQNWFPHDPLPLHLLTLLVHAVNATMVGLLAQQLLQRPAAGLIATALFVAYPFQYQAMLSAGSLSKPVSALLVLLAVLLYWQGRSQKDRWALAGALLAALLAPFAYEAAATSGGFLMLAEFALWRTGRIARPARGALALPLLGVPFVIAWALVPSSYQAITFPGFEALWQSSIYFQQALTWPLALLARPLMRWTGLSDGWATALVTGIALLLLVIFYVRRRRGWVLLIACAWMVLSVLTQWVVLPFRYIIDSPRILYLGGAGFALLATDLLVAARATPWRQVLSAVALILMVTWGGLFARQRVKLTAAVAAPLEEMIALAAALPDEPTVFVNVPRWFGMAAGQAGFALGHEGYTIFPSYYDVGPSDYVWVNTGKQYEIACLDYPNIREEWQVNLGYGDKESEEPLTVLPEAQTVYALAYGAETLSWRELGGAAGDAEATPLACYGEALCLTAVQVTPLDDRLKVELVWRVAAPPTEPLAVFLHLYRADGALATQDDGEPFEGLLPFAQWAPGEVHRDTHYLPLEAITVGSDYTLGVGVYQAVSGERQAATDTAGQPLTDDTYRTSLPQTALQP